MVFYGRCVHKRLNEERVYQIEIPHKDVIWDFPMLTVNRSGKLPPGFIAVEPPEVFEEVEFDSSTIKEDLC